MINLVPNIFKIASKVYCRNKIYHCGYICNMIRKILHDILFFNMRNFTITCVILISSYENLFVMTNFLCVYFC